MKTLYAFVKSKTKNSPAERVAIYSGKTMDYYFFAQFPICEDGHRDEINEELERRGWSCGMGGLTYKKRVSYKEILSCMLYTRAYRKTYEFLTEPSPLINVPVKIVEFLDLVELKAKIEREHGKQFPKEMTWKNLVPFLEKEGFTLDPSQ